MNLYQLTCFVSVAQNLNFTKAARQNYISQSAISRQIQELEKSLGVCLFRRSKHGVSLTGEGVELLRYATELLSLADEAERRILGFMKGRTGHIRISMLSNCSEPLIRCLSVFSKRYPQIYLSISRDTGTIQREAFMSPEYDFYFTTMSTIHALPHRDQFSYVPSHRDDFSILAHESRASQIDPDDLTGLADIPFAFFSRSIGPILFDMVMNICRNRHYVPMITNYYNSAEMVMLSVCADVGITILPDTLIFPTALKNVVSIPIKGEDASLLSLIAWPKETSNEAALLFRDIVLELYPAEFNPGQTSAPVPPDCCCGLGWSVEAGGVQADGGPYLRSGH
jgi:DNA-binding transcriptional LysR family regulator